MAPTPWHVYPTALYKIGAGQLPLTGSFMMMLVQDSSNFEDDDPDTLSDIGDELANGNGYTTGGAALAGESWGEGISVGQQKFTVTNPVFNATSAGFTGIAGAVIYAAGASDGVRHVLAWMRATVTPFNIAGGSSITIGINAAGVFTMANAA